ncbi:2'-5' RNA ligase family protein [Shewanella violacea]|uniref:RNA 2',3'-cyclic phosphodiesterase n=1 Tax=Shewanella violacea (strain JCM 10179 / CIP 106290 / LMG 19151 / DSS12) TaxID=637905 RepID=D4ZC43_SHEVD|nr:2'-5' RNA ligase family protein [Shewanella violacea]BAJ03588.1 2'-5' RNA ligase, putative [Shewanella violacea DSS12]
MQRLFLGVSPTKQQVNQLCDIQSLLKAAGHKGYGRPVNRNNFHMTLAFLGQTHDACLAQLIKAIDLMAHTDGWTKFSITFDKLTLWRKPQVLCLSAPSLTQVSLNPDLYYAVEHCQRIIHSIQSKSAPSSSIDNGVEQLTRPHLHFTPHITLLRKAKLLPKETLMQLGLTPITLTPNQMHLYQSVSGERGVEYHILQSWPLV